MKNWRSIAKGIIAIVTGIAASYLGATSFGTDCYDPSVMASWVQAVGAIAAIVWAGKYTNDQMNSQRELQQLAARNALAQRLESFIAVCGVAVQEGANAVLSMRDGTQLLRYALSTYEPKTFDGLAAALQAFPIHELPNARAVATAQRFRDGFMHLSKAIANWVDAVRAVRRHADDEADAVERAMQYVVGQRDALQKIHHDLLQS